MPKTPYLYKQPRSPYYWGQVMVNGKRYRKALSENKAQAIRLYEEWREELKGGAKGENITWSAFKKDFLAYAKAQSQPKTYSRFEGAIEYLEQYIKPQSLADITPKALDLLKTHLVDAGKAAPGINRNVKALKRMMRQAEAWDLIAPSMWRLVKKIQEVRPKIQFFTPQEIQYMFTLAPYNYKVAVLLGARAGLRPSEIRNLTWEDIDFEQGTITIQPKKDWRPKTCECRIIPMSEDLKQYFNTMTRKGKYILLTDYGERFTEQGFSLCFKEKLLRQVNKRLKEELKNKAPKIEGSAKKLRSTFACHLLQNGADLFAISKLLGHSSVKTTEGHYAEFIPKNFTDRIKLLPKITL